jgi:hypothetical protein
VIVANALADLTTNVSVPETFVFALGNTVEPLVVSELIQRCFGSSFTSATRLKAPPRGNMIAGPADKTESLNDLGAVISQLTFVMAESAIFYLNHCRFDLAVGQKASGGLIVVCPVI